MKQVNKDKLNKYDLPEEARQIVEDNYDEVLDITDKLEDNSALEDNLNAFWAQLDAIINDDSSQSHGKRLVCAKISELTPVHGQKRQVKSVSTKDLEEIVDSSETNDFVDPSEINDFMEVF